MSTLGAKMASGLFVVTDEEGDPVEQDLPSEETIEEDIARADRKNITVADAE